MDELSAEVEVLESYVHERAPPRPIHYTLLIKAQEARQNRRIDQQNLALAKEAVRQRAAGRDRREADLLQDAIAYCAFVECVRFHTVEVAYPREGADLRR